jgi:uncharacterized protein
MKFGDAMAIAAIRRTLGAIDNAGSVDVNSNQDPPTSSRGIAGSVQGLGPGDVPRREMDEGQIIDVVRAEVTSRKEAAQEYQDLGRVDEADRLRSEYNLLLRLLPNDTSR